MWDRKDSVTERTQQPAGARVESQPGVNPPAASGTASRGRAANIGGSLFIKGEVSGSEDMTVEGHVEGKIHLKDHNLSIAPSGRVSAEIHAKSVTVHGEVTGDIHADEKVEITETGRLEGDLFAPRVAISDGARFRGSVDMSRGTGTRPVAGTRPSQQVTDGRQVPVPDQRAATGVAARGGQARPAPPQAKAAGQA